MLPHDRAHIAAAGFCRQAGFRLVDPPRPLALARRAAKQSGHFFLERKGAVLRRTDPRTLQD
jgi:hypothetical protein